MRRVLVRGHGGTFRYILAAFGPLPAFLYGWANWLAIQAGALGVVGLILVENLEIVIGRRSFAPHTQVLLAAALIDKLNAPHGAFSPWGYRLR